MSPGEIPQAYPLIEQWDTTRFRDFKRERVSRKHRRQDRKWFYSSDGVIGRDRANPYRDADSRSRAFSSSASTSC
jgi:hypothetical protein